MPSRPQRTRRPQLKSARLYLPTGTNRLALRTSEKHYDFAIADRRADERDVVEGG
jgi:hypothetical protein